MLNETSEVLRTILWLLIISNDSSDSNYLALNDFINESQLRLNLINSKEWFLIIDDINQFRSIIGNPPFFKMRSYLFNDNSTVFFSSIQKKIYWLDELTNW